MRADAAAYERGRRALRRRLALDFEPLREALARGLGVAVQAEAAVYCTAAVEALCEALFAAALPLVQATGPPSLGASHLQLALRGHAALSALLRRVPGAELALGFFLDDATSRELYARRRIATGEATHLRRRLRTEDGKAGDEVGDEGEDELAARHLRARQEWTRRADAPFADEDFAAVLKSAHPAFSLAYGAVALLDALVRKLLNAVCEQLPLDELGDGGDDSGDGGDGGDAVRAMTVDDVAGALDRVLGMDAGADDALSRFLTRTARDCVRRFEAAGADADGDEDGDEDLSARTDVRFRVVHPSAPAAALLFPPLGLVLPGVSASAPFAQLVPLLRRRGRVADGRNAAAAWLAVYRGREVDPRATPRTLGLPSGSFPSEVASGSLLAATLAVPNAPFVFLVPRKWWDAARRSAARRGRLASQRPQDARVRSLVAASESKVKRVLRPSPSPTASSSPTASAKAAALSPKRVHSRSAATLASPSALGPHLTADAGDDSLSALLRPHRRVEDASNLFADQTEDEAAAGLADALRAAAARVQLRPRARARDEWAGRVRALDALVARTQAARVDAAQILARVGAGANPGRDGPQDARPRPHPRPQIDPY